MNPAPILRGSILLVDDEKVVQESLRSAFKGDHELYVAATAHQARRHLRHHAIDLAYLNIRLPDMNGIDLLKEIKQIAPALRVIMLTAVPDVETAVAAMKNGAFDVLPKPLDIPHIQILTRKALPSKKARLTRPGSKKGKAMADRDVSVRNIFKIIASILPYEGHVLIEGPRGTGKRRIAQALHNHSARAARPYVTIDCAAMPATRLERELFGLQREALRGVWLNDPSKIDLAHTGSLFINNINYLALDLQDRLLHLLEHREFERPGANGPVKADVRIIAAATQNLRALVDARLFRKNLYARLNALPLSLPLLRERGEDIGLLLMHFMKHHPGRHDEMRQDVSPEARSPAMPCDWPSGAREFEHLIGRLCNLHRGQPLPAAESPEMPRREDPDALDLKNATRAFERQHILSVLKTVNGSRAQAARRLGIHRNTLRLKTKELGIDCHWAKGRAI